MLSGYDLEQAHRIPDLRLLFGFQQLPVWVILQNIAMLLYTGYLKAGILFLILIIVSV